MTAVCWDEDTRRKDAFGSPEISAQVVFQMELMTLWKGCADPVGISQWWDIISVP